VHIHGTEGRISLGIPFNIPPDLPTTVDITAGGRPPVHPDTQTMTFPPADQYTVEVEAFGRAVLDGEPVPIPPEDGVANLRVIEQIVAAAEG
jgi:predicted dehydrogenase